MGREGVLVLVVELPLEGVLMVVCPQIQTSFFSELTKLISSNPIIGRRM